MRTSTIASKDWILADLMKDSNNFQEVRRVSCLDNAWTATAEECERQGIPLIVEGWHAHHSWLEAFSADFLVARHPSEGKLCATLQCVSSLNHMCISVVSVRNVGNFKDADMTLSDFVEYSRMAPPHSNRGIPLLPGSLTDHSDDTWLSFQMRFCMRRMWNVRKNGGSGSAQALSRQSCNPMGVRIS